MKRVKRFGVLQTSKVGAIIIFLTTLIILVPIGILAMIGGTISGKLFPFAGGFIFFILPFVYGIFGFIMTAISCLIYNVIAGRIGGIELEFETVDEQEG